MSTERSAESKQATSEDKPGATTDEGLVEPETGEAASPQAGDDDEVASLRAALEEAEAKASEYWDRLLRTEAEKDNIRKRAEREAETARRQGMERLAGEMLAVRDSLELGVAAAREPGADVERIREGTELTLTVLTQAMEKVGIEEIDPVGEKFDPELHQAMSAQESGEHPPNTVVAVMQKGYRLGDRLLRPALVMVARAPDSGAADNGSNAGSDESA